MADAEGFVTVYGADWCGPTRKSRAFLDRLRIPYTYVNVEEDQSASAWVREQNGGQELKPTITVGERVLRAPSEAELNMALEEYGVISSA